MEYIVNADDIFNLLASEKVINEESWVHTNKGSYYDYDSDKNYIIQTNNTINIGLNVKAMKLGELTNMIGEKLRDMGIEFHSMGMMNDYIHINRYRDPNKTYSIGENDGDF